MNALRPLALILGLIAVSITAAVAQERVPATIDLSAAELALKADSARDQNATKQFRAAPAQNMANVTVPVLLLGSAANERAPQMVVGQSSAYAALYTVKDAQLSVLGSGTVLESDIADQVPDTDAGSFDTSEEGADYSFIRFGASYTLRLTCDYPDDAKCLEPAYLKGIADALIVVQVPK